MVDPFIPLTPLTEAAFKRELKMYDEPHNACYVIVLGKAKVSVPYRAVYGSGRTHFTIGGDVEIEDVAKKEVPKEDVEPKNHFDFPRRKYIIGDGNENKTH